jgi:hypothetical protein
MAGVLLEVEEAPEGGGGIRNVLTMGSLVSPSGNEVLFLSVSFACVLPLLQLSISVYPLFLLRFLLADIWPFRLSVSFNSSPCFPVRPP